jgi:hypothetical protein
MNLKFPFILLVSLLLLSCDNLRYQKELQKILNRNNNQTLCYSLPNGPEMFPKDVFYHSPTEILDLFVDLGLLETENITAVERHKDDTVIVNGLRYDLTTEGNNYFVKTKGAFCFGNIVIDEVYDTYDSELLKSHTSFEKVKKIEYNYYYSDIPDWAKDQRFAQYYESIPLNSEILYAATAIYFKSSGNYRTGIDTKKLITLKHKTKKD